MKQPGSIKAAEAYRYGVTKKSPNGTPYDPALCMKIVCNPANPYDTWQCSHKKSKGHRGLWCGKHTALEALQKKKTTPID